MTDRMSKLMFAHSDDLYALRKLRVGHGPAPARNMSDAALRQRGEEAALKRRDPHAVGVVMDANRKRIVIGDVEAGEHGRLMTEHDQSADVIHLHGLAFPLADIRRDLRMALVVSSTAFSRAITAEMQSEQRAVIGAVVQAILTQHPAIGAKIQEIKTRERYD
jgi:hypothetical protein